MTQLTDKMTIDALARLRVSVEANTAYELKLMAKKWKSEKVPMPEFFHIDFSPRSRRGNTALQPTFISGACGGGGGGYGSYSGELA
jgi:hypothetical protein